MPSLEKLALRTFLQVLSSLPWAVAFRVVMSHQTPTSCRSGPQFWGHFASVYYIVLVCFTLISFVLLAYLEKKAIDRTMKEAKSTLDTICFWIFRIFYFCTALTFFGLVFNASQVQDKCPDLQELSQIFIVIHIMFGIALIIAVFIGHWTGNRYLRDLDFFQYFFYTGEKQERNRNQGRDYGLINQENDDSQIQYTNDGEIIGEISMKKE